MFGIEKDFQQLMEQAYGPLSEPVKYETPMTKNEEEIEEVKAQIKVLEKKLSFLEELEKTKSPVEEAFRDNYGVYPNELKTIDDLNCWKSFKRGYNAAYKEKVSQEPAKNVVSLYERFVNEGAYGMTSFENALRVVNDFLLDEGVIEDESGEYITFTLQKSLLEVSND
jgi:predicted nuclease with TOPRIM domain